MLMEMRSFTAKLFVPLVLFLQVAASSPLAHKKGPFLQILNETHSIIGNDLWNITQGPTFATKLFYKDHDCIGDAVGHYVSYSK